MQVEKGEAFEWVLEDKNTVWLRRVVQNLCAPLQKSQSHRFDNPFLALDRPALVQDADEQWVVMSKPSFLLKAV